MSHDGTKPKRGGWTNAASAANGRTSTHGGRPRTNLKLDQATARSLKILTLQRRQITPAATEETIVAELVGMAAQELDAEYERHAAADMAQSQPLD